MTENENIYGTDACIKSILIARKIKNGLYVLDQDKNYLKHHLQNCNYCRADIAAIELISSEDTSNIKDDLFERKLFNEVIAIAEQKDFEKQIAIDEKSNLIRRKKISKVLPMVAAVAAVLLISFVFYKLDFNDDNFQANNDNNAQTNKLVLNSIAKPTKVETKKDKLSISKTNIKTSSSITEQNSKSIIATGNQRTVIYLTPDITVIAESKSEISMGQVNDQLMEIVLSKGELIASVNPKRKGPKFVVSTVFGSVEVKGTVFRVRVLDRYTEVNVLRGSVKVTSKTGQNHMIKNGFGMNIGSDEFGLGPDRVADIKSKLSMQNNIESNEVAVLDLSEVLPNGQIIAPKNNKEDVVESLETEPTTVAMNAKRKPKLKQLLAQARAYKKENNWEKALTAYAKIGRYYSHTAEGAASFVVMGNIKLERQGRAASALKNFNKYIALGKTTLLQEALFGKAKALRQVGRNYEELETLRRFATKFSGSVHIKNVKKRIRDLEQSL